MKINLNLVIIFAFLAIIVSGCCCGDSPDVTPVMSTTHSKQYNQVINGEKPVIIKFTLNGCGACVKVAPIFDAISKTYANSAEFVIADADDDYDLAREYGVRAYPTIFIVKPQSTVRTQIPYEIIFDENTFSEYLDANLKNYYVKTPEEYYDLAKQAYSKGEYQTALNYYKIVQEFYPDNANLKTAIANTEEKLIESGM